MAYECQYAIYNLGSLFLIEMLSPVVLLIIVLALRVKKLPARLRAKFTEKREVLFTLSNFLDELSDNFLLKCVVCLLNLSYITDSDASSVLTGIYTVFYSVVIVALPFMIGINLNYFSKRTPPKKSESLEKVKT